MVEQPDCSPVPGCEPRCFSCNPHRAIGAAAAGEADFICSRGAMRCNAPVGAALDTAYAPPDPRRQRARRSITIALQIADGH